MSKVGKHPVSMPSGVKFSFEGNILTLSGPSGRHDISVPESLSLSIEGDKITVIPRDQHRLTRALWGTLRSLIDHKVKGLVKPFEKTVDLVGVGYKASVQGKKLVMQLGYSHDVEFQIPDAVQIRCDKPTQMVVSSFDKQLAGHVVAQIIDFRPPEPYKGKGLILQGKPVFRKEGKKK